MTALVAGYPPVHRLRLTAPAGAVADRRLNRPVRVIPRHVFDARLLADVCSRGAQFRRHAVRTVTCTPDGVVLDGTLRAAVVIGADGAQSVMRHAGSVNVRRPG